jgi:hypothetical protein
MAAVDGEWAARQLPTGVGGGSRVVAVEKGGTG